MRSLERRTGIARLKRDEEINIFPLSRLFRVLCTCSSPQPVEHRWAPRKGCCAASENFSYANPPGIGQTPLGSTYALGRPRYPRLTGEQIDVATNDERLPADIVVRIGGFGDGQYDLARYRD